MSDTFTAKVRGLSSEGYGVAEHPDGRVFFVPATWPGDEIEAEIATVEKRYGYGRLRKLISPSPERAPSVPCAHQGVGEGRCGGCPWMIGTYESQLGHKQTRLEHALGRAKLLNDGVLRAAWGSQPLGYRNRAQFKSDGTHLGFVREGTRELVDIDDCVVLNEPMRGLLRDVRAQLPNAAWKPADGHDWTFLDVDDAIADAATITINRRRPFRQGNSAQNERMKQWVSERAQTAGGAYLELFAGSGNFTEALSSLGRTYAVEVDRDAVDGLRARELPNVQAEAYDLFKPASLRILGRDLRDQVKTLVLDPPRAGMKGVERLAADLGGALRTVLYVSCDGPTFVRDAAALVKSGWRLTEVQPIDLFPQTPHLETLSVFTKKS